MVGGESTVYRGHEGVRELWRDIGEAFAEFHIELSEIRDLGERVVAIGHLRGRGKASGAVVESPIGYVADFKNGKAIRIDDYFDPEPSPRSRWPFGVGDVAGERGVRARGASTRSIGTTGMRRRNSGRLRSSSTFTRRDAAIFRMCHWTPAAPTAIIDGFKKLADPWSEARLEPLEFIPAPDGSVVVLTRFTAQGKGSGVPVTVHYFQVWAIRDRKVNDIAVFVNRADALDAAGLRSRRCRRRTSSLFGGSSRPSIEATLRERLRLRTHHRSSSSCPPGSSSLTFRTSSVDRRD